MKLDNAKIFGDIFCYEGESRVEVLYFRGDGIYIVRKDDINCTPCQGHFELV